MAMSKNSVYGVVLAGGRGERFWPLSTTQRPKQFLKLISDKMMLEETMDRVLPIIPKENFRIVTSDTMAELITKSVKGMNEENILGEPSGRNTCLAIGLAAAHLKKENESAVMVVLSADHLIRPPERLCELINVGVNIALKEDKLITIGIVPTRPETAYGYIKLGEDFKKSEHSSVYEVQAFTEKPKAAVAHEYYFSGGYLWNSGMFIWSAESILKAIETCQPALASALEEYAEKIGTKGESKAREKLYEKALSISIDVAVLENAKNVLTIKADIVWDDIGSWNALERYKEHDADNNVVVGSALTESSFETTVYNDTDGLVACLGVSDLVVVRTKDVTLVVHKTQTSNIKSLLALIEQNENYREFL
jgi:mannose-1-phosphate guanylyltransferase